MIDKIKAYATNRYVLAICAGILALLILYGCRSCGRGGGTDSTVESIEANIAGAGADIAAGRQDVETAGREVSGAAAAVGEVQGIIDGSIQQVKDSRAGLDECQALIRRSIEQNRTAQDIMSAVEAGHSQGTGDGQKRKN